MLLRLGRAPLFLQCRQLLAAALLSSLRPLIASTNQRQIQRESSTGRETHGEGGQRQRQKEIEKEERNEQELSSSAGRGQQEEAAAAHKDYVKAGGTVA